MREWLQHDAWKTIVRPYLENLGNTALPDPSEIAGLGDKNKDEWVWRSLQAAIMRKVVKELIEMLEKKAEEAKYLLEKEQGKVTKEFRIGG